MTTRWWTTCLEVLPTRERAKGRFHLYDSSAPVCWNLSAWARRHGRTPIPRFLSDPCGARRSCRITSGTPAPPIGVDDLTEAAAGCAISHVRPSDGHSPVMRFISAARRPLPELTLTDQGWSWHPRLASEPPFLAHPAEIPPLAAFVDAARSRAVQVLLEELQAQNLLLPPNYCAG